MKRRAFLKSLFSFLLMVLLMWGTGALAAELRVPSQYASIQAAIDVAAPGDVVLVADGTYEGNLVVQESITIRSENGWEKTKIDCANQGRGVIFSGPSTSGAMLRGFTITGGNAATGSGGAILCEGNASPTISECVLSANLATSGGAIASIQSSPIISHCIVERNTASSVGGGLYVKNISASDPSPMIVGCTIANNNARRGGAVYLFYYASPSFYNCLIVDNSASEFGGAFYCYRQCAPDIIHCTVSNNTSSSHGSGIFCILCPDPYYPVITNSIMWGNVATNGAEIYLTSSRLDISFSAFDPGVERRNILVAGTSTLSEEANIYENPAFVGEGDYHLSPDSPCMDSGTVQIELPECDFEGDPRILGDAPDMGADEFAPEEIVIKVEIDIRPESAENKINLKSWGVLAVAVKSIDGFDALSIDPSTVVFAEATPVWQIAYDVDRDRDKDMLFFFRVQSLNLDENSIEATLTGMMKDGKSFEGTDKVTIIKPKGKAVGWHFGKR
jgi:hypothetical protein